MHNSLSNQTDVEKLAGAIATDPAEAEIANSVVTDNCWSVEFELVTGAITSASYMHLRGSSDDVTFVDVAGSNLVIPTTGDNLVYRIECIRPQFKYLRLMVGPNIVVVSAVARRGHQRTEPVVDTGRLVVASPVEGTP